MILHMRHTLWAGISETNVNSITSATRTHALIIILSLLSVELHELHFLIIGVCVSGKYWR